ncbi:PH domain-containing protein [Ancylomarina sp. DW003]|nr:PH domain-containing protein [Ancylomarina sp. DW003]MDE5423537.1 PH domain-containing protein [Ancylomarina sp. DW003]
MLKDSFDTPRRQSVTGTLFFLLMSVQKVIRMFWPLLLLYVFKGNASKMMEPKWLIGLLFLILILIAHSILTWYNFYFLIKDKEFVLRKGYLKRVVIAIPFEKIVSINLKQGLIQQVLGVVQLEVDSAGSKKKEVAIYAISREIAEALKEQLASYKKDSSDSEDSLIAEENIVEQETILQLSLKDLFRISIAKNHLRGLLIILAFGNNIYYQLKDLFESEVNLAADKTESFLEHSSTLALAGVVIFVLLLSLIISMADVFLRYYDFNMKSFANAFSLQSGLIKRKNITIPFSKIQRLKRSINPIQKWLNISNIQLVQANSIEVSKEKDKVAVPGCDDEKFKELCDKVYDNPFSQPTYDTKPQKVFLRRSFIFLFIFMSVPVFALSLKFNWMWYLEILVPFLAAGIAYLSYYRRSYHLSSDFLKINSGLIAKDFSIIEVYKVQTVHIKRTIFQRRNGTASLDLGMAGSVVRIEYLSYDEAIRMKDQILYKIEVTKKKWM